MSTPTPDFVPLLQVLSPQSTGAATPPARGWPVLRLGFRPFYLGAAVFAVLAVPLWVAMLLGAVPAQMALPPMLWHAHEMLFGFAAAVIVGFLLTAGKAWTGLATPRGAGLGALALLWLAARVAGVWGPQPLFAVLDVALLPLVAGLLTTVLLRAGNRRNLPLALILLLLGAANGVFHLAALGRIDVSPLAALHAGLALIVMIECVMAGRVVPAFTISATPGLKLASHPRLDIATLALTALGLAGWVLLPAGPLTAVLLAAAAALHAHRLWRWQPGVTRGRPILWILHLSYAWIPLGLALLALSQVGVLGVSHGVHALAVGATGGLIIGMVTRTARGHTGRPLKVSRAEVAAYALVMAAALLRALVPLAVPSSTVPLIAAALAWSTAFGLYLWVFTPWLLSTRLDGKDG
ncbi:NnrS family protein [Ideonella sp. A 288]|uniref:NnrS family protein n=1 Tax=Ideonella sp. A 288 TaxID=1962181 RepID=UPI000B4B83BF|nr:NnrS family protein [Ideonella sp. A 288]